MFRSLLAAFPLLLTTLLAAETDWPQWRGPSRDGTVKGKAWPENLTGLRREWLVPLGPSYSGPIVAGERVFTTESRDKTFESAKALDRKTGKELWSTQWEGYQKVPFFAASNGDWIRSTPAYDGERLYVAGMRDRLLCLVAATGKKLWEIDFVAQCQTPPPAFGFVCSPLLVGEALFVQAGAALCKVNKKTGQILWRSARDEGGMEGSAFSSPILAELADVPQLLVQTRQELHGVDPANGQVHWTQKIPAFRGMNILTPVVSGNRLFTSAYGGKTLAFDVAKSAAGPVAQPAWELKAEGYMSTPVIIKGHAYLHLRNQRFACIDLAQGKQTWVTKEKFGKYWSLVAQGERILALDERGLLLLIQANPEAFVLLDQKKVSEEETWAHLAVSGDELFIRDLRGMACWKWAGQ